MIEPCTYCGVVADSIDHIPPLIMRAALQELGDYIGVWRTVPACRWCNSVLGCRALLTVHDRRMFVKQILRRKFKRLLKMPNWTEEMLQELSEGLRGYVIDSIEKARVVRARLAWDGQRRHWQGDARYSDRVTGGQTTAFLTPSCEPFVVTKTQEAGFTRTEVRAMTIARFNDRIAQRWAEEDK